MAQRQATETLNIDQARERLSTSIHWSDIVLERLSPYLLDSPNMQILEIGSAQGRALIGLAQAGYQVYGIEPYLPAIQVARQLAKDENVQIDIREGRAEEIPFQSNFFDLVLAFSVIEHVEDLSASLSEIARVLKPGGLFWFSSASSMCPSQGEIRGFPLFGWYPDYLKQKVMVWSKSNHPELIGYTEHPAMHWWTPSNTKRRLKTAGFDKIWDRWDLRLSSEDHGILRIMIGLAKRSNYFRKIGDMISPGCSYAARKSMVAHNK